MSTRISLKLYQRGKVSGVRLWTRSRLAQPARLNLSAACLSVFGLRGKSILTNVATAMSSQPIAGLVPAETSVAPNNANAKLKRLSMSCCSLGRQLEGAINLTIYTTRFVANAIIEEPYAFTTVEKLIDDFKRDVRRMFCVAVLRWTKLTSQNSKWVRGVSRQSWVSHPALLSLGGRGLGVFTQPRPRADMGNYRSWSSQTVRLLAPFLAVT
jgi:hypothetical protein